MCSHYENEQRFLGPPNDGNRCFLALLSTEEGTGSGSAASVRWRRGAGLQATGLLGCGAGAGGGDGCPSQLAAWRRENSGPCSRNQLGWPLFSLHVKCKEMTSMCQALHRAPCWGGSLTASSQHPHSTVQVLPLSSPYGGERPPSRHAGCRRGVRVPTQLSGYFSHSIPGWQGGNRSSGSNLFLFVCPCIPLFPTHIYPAQISIRSRCQVRSQRRVKGASPLSAGGGTRLAVQSA